MTNVFVIKLLKLFCFTKAFSDVPDGKHYSMSIVALRGKRCTPSMYLLFTLVHWHVPSMFYDFEIFEILFFYGYYVPAKNIYIGICIKYIKKYTKTSYPKINYFYSTIGNI